MSSNSDVQRRANERFREKNPDYNRDWKRLNTVVNDQKPHKDKDNNIGTLMRGWK